MQKTSFKSTISLLVSMLILCGLIAYFIYNQSNMYEKSLERYSGVIISEIEQYHACNGHLPQSLEQLFPNNKPLTDVYTLQTYANGTYILTFTTPKGDSKVYDSAKQTWITK